MLRHEVPQTQSATLWLTDVRKDLKRVTNKSRNVWDVSRPSRGESPLKRRSVPQLSTWTIPTNATDTKSHSFAKRAGPFLLGPPVSHSPVKCMTHYLARKDGTDDFFVLKILTLKDKGEKCTADDIQGKTLFQAEHSLLSLVKSEEGVIHEHGMFWETVMEVVKDDKGVESLKSVRRVCLVLDCFVGHDYSPKYRSITNLQCTVIKEKKMAEAKALRIFYEVVKIVERLHKRNIIHRDLKLGNIIFDQDSEKVSISNFCLGKHICSDTNLLKDQRGSPAYISPDVISGKPYQGKPSDMWSLGIVLYTMVFGQFPFYDVSPPELFRKIKLGLYQIPTDTQVSEQTVDLIKSLLTLDPKTRLTASQALNKVRTIIEEGQSLMWESDLQVVPNFRSGAERKRDNFELGSLAVDFVEIAKYILDKCPEFREISESPKKKIKTGHVSSIVALPTNEELNNQLVYDPRKDLDDSVVPVYNFDV